MGEYVIYLRKSRADLEAEAHGEGETLLRHEKELISLSKKMHINVTQVYREIVSGETIAARPIMQQLLSEVETGRWTGVLVMEVERLARGETLDQGIVAQAFKYSNTKIITPIKTYDPSNEFDEEYFEFNLFMSRREYKTINRRIQRGRIASAKEGKFLSSVAPYGYKKVKIENDKGYTLEIIPDQADVIRKIYNWYTVGDLQSDGSYLKLGASRIASKLNELGYRPMIKDSWTKSSISDILKNPVYAGKIRWSYRKEKKYIKNNEIIVSRNDSKDDDYILVDGLHEAIIDAETYNVAQQIIAKRGHPPVPGSDVLKYPLTGLLYCGKCKSLMTRLAKSNKTPYDTVKCPNTKCDNISAPLYLVEEVLIDTLKNWVDEYKAKWNYEKQNDPYADSIVEKRLELKQVKDKLAKLEFQKERIHDLLEQGVYTVEVFTERNKKIASESESLHNTINNINEDLEYLNDMINKTEVFIPNAENILEKYFTLDSAATRNDALKELLRKVEYVKSEQNKKGNRDNANFSIELFLKISKI